MKRALLALVFLAASGCGAGGDVVGAIIGAGEVKERQVQLPSQILGLLVVPEEVSKEVFKNKRPYIDGVGLFSLREKDLVRATLQVSRFNALADPNDPEFRNSIIDQVGATRPVRLRIGKIFVYTTSGAEQNLFLWFEGRTFFVLTTHREYEFPRTLLRRVTELGAEL